MNDAFLSANQVRGITELKLRLEFVVKTQQKRM